MINLYTPATELDEPNAPYLSDKWSPLGGVAAMASQKRGAKILRIYWQSRQTGGDFV